MVEGASKVVIEVDDQARALAFWTETLGFDLHQDTPYGEERWVEVRTPDERLILVLSPRQHERRGAPDMLPTSNVFFTATTSSRRTRSCAHAEWRSRSRRSS